MIIYWRVSENQDTNSFTARWENKDKKELLRKCWASLQQSVSSEDRIFILWDKVRPVTIDWLVKTSKTSNITVKHCPIYPLDIAIEKELGSVMDKRKNHFLSLVHIVEEHIKQYPDDIHYVCEDDYLHVPHSLDIIKSVFEDGWNGFVVPYDYPDRYYLDRTRNCELLLNKYSHWRTVPSSTATTSALGKTWQQFIHLIKQNAIYNSDSFSWEIFSKVGCLAPIPGLSTHLTNGCLTPRIDWKNIYECTDIGADSWQ